MKAHDFPEVYKALGINLNKLGCVMLDLEPFPMPTYIIQDYVTGTQSNYNQFIEPMLYVSEDKEKFWIDGWVSGKVPHITLLYGLLETAKNYESYIDSVLKGWKLNEVEIANVGYFESPYADEPYYCIVAHIKVTPELLEGNERLEFLPHINTFPGYKPHMTICYLKKDKMFRDDFINEMKKALIGKKLKVSDKINLGGDK